MLEFYQAYTDYRGVMDLTQELITQAAQRGDRREKNEVDGQRGDAGNRLVSSNWRRMTMREAIIEYWPASAGAKPEMVDFASHDSVKALVARFNSGTLHMAYDPNEPAGKTIASLFEAVAEEHLMQPTIIYEFPTAVSPLSKQKADEPDWTERWEIYTGQMEICERLQRIERSRRAAPTLRSATERTRARRRRGPPDG